jgi:hypothetical protein
MESGRPFSETGPKTARHVHARLPGPYSGSLGHSRRIGERVEQFRAELDPRLAEERVVGPAKG